MEHARDHIGVLPVLILRSIAQRCVSKDGRKGRCKRPSFETQAFALRGEGLLLRMRTESVEKTDFTALLN